ncbi:MAG: hypothetical protein ACREO8_07885 [Luteimonas sp.]
MKTTRRLAFATALVAGMLTVGAAVAQSAGSCPSLPKDSGLSWKELARTDFTFCKALRDSDGGEAFAVTIAKKSPFKPKRTNREERTSIDGHQGYWYRSEVASAPTLQVRETLIELADGHVAHISVRATSPEQLSAVIQRAESIRFLTTQLSSK